MTYPFPAGLITRVNGVYNGGDTTYEIQFEVLLTEQIRA